MLLGSVQPTYLPWLPFFKRMSVSDVFVYLDDVEFSKNSPHNRNRIKTASGPLMLTVPVRYKGNSRAFLHEMPVASSDSWAAKHWRSIQQSYSKAKHFSELAPILRPLYEREWGSLGDLNIAFIEAFREFLGIETPCYRSSALAVEGQGNQKLVNLCRRLGADRFIVKPGTHGYHPAEEFLPHGIGFEYFDYSVPPYPQLYGEYVPFLSVLDYAMNCGEARL